MPTIDLTGLAPAPLPAGGGTDGGAHAAAPRPIGQTHAELQHAAHLAGDAPLPFEIAAPQVTDAMQARLGQSPAALDDESFRRAVAALHDPAESLARRGLVADEVLDPGLAGAIGLLAAPRLALDIDVTMAGVQAKVWHRQEGGAVASLATVDGIVFELGWFATDAWAGELARVAAVSEEVELGESAVPSYVDLPFELADAAAEASGSGRGDLLPVLVARHGGAVRTRRGPLSDEAAVGVLTALAGEARGRLRALVADVSGAEVDTVGVVSWTLLANGWRALRPHHEDGVLRLEVRAMAPEDLSLLVAPALGEAIR
jgi:hypothetical protein